MKRIPGAAAVAAGVAILAACSGGIDLAPPGAPARVSGVLLGTVTRPAGTFQALALVSGDRFMGYDLGGVFYDGRFTLSGTDATASSIRVYAGDPVGRPFLRQVSETAPMSASVTSGGWNGSIAAAGGAITFDLDYDRETDAQDSSLSFVEGDWLLESGTYRSALAVAANGTTTTTNTDNGNSTFCDSSGAAGIIEAPYGLYAWETTLAGAGCGNLDDLPYTGLAILTDNAQPLGRLTVLLANANYFLRFTPYERQP